MGSPALLPPWGLGRQQLSQVRLLLWGTDGSADGWPSTAAERTADAQHLWRLTKSSKYLLHRQSFYTIQSLPISEFSMSFNRWLKTLFQETVPSLPHSVAAFYSLFVQMDSVSSMSSPVDAGLQAPGTRLCPVRVTLTPLWVSHRAHAHQPEYEPFRGESVRRLCPAAPYPHPRIPNEKRLVKRLMHVTNGTTLFSISQLLPIVMNTADVCVCGYCSLLCWGGTVPEAAAPSDALYRSGRPRIEPRSSPPGGHRARRSLVHQTLPDMTLRARSWGGKVSNTPGSRLLRPCPSAGARDRCVAAENQEGPRQSSVHGVSEPRHHGHVRLENVCCWQGVLCCETLCSVLASTHQVPVTLRLPCPQASCDRRRVSGRGRRFLVGKGPLLQGDLG